MKKEKIFITGGAGYLGCVLTSHLLKRDQRVKVFDNLHFGQNPLKAFLDNPHFEFVKGDICDTDLLCKEMEDSISVVHLAAIVGDIPCEKNREDAIKVNQDASISLIDQCRDNGKKFVFASTASSYGIYPGKILSEISELNPVSLYAETKIAVEQYLSSIDITDLQYTVLRLGTAYGLSLRMRQDLLIHFLVKKIVSKQKVSVYGQKLYRPYVHNSDIANAVEKIIISPSEIVSGEIFNVVGENLNKEDLLNILRKFRSFEVDFVENSDDLRDYRITGEKLRKKIGFETTRRVEDVLPALIQASELGVY